MKRPMAWINYHSHCYYCDGSSQPEDYIKKAISLQMPAYGFSSHAPVPFSTNWCIPDNKLADYLSEIESLKKQFSQKIQIYRGLEIDYIPGIAGRNKHLNKNINLDYFICSIHFVENKYNGEGWNIDTSFEEFQQGFKEIFNNNIRKAATRFWELTRQMIEEEKPDIIGHLDKIKMFNTIGHFFDEREKWYRDQVELTLKCIKKSDCRVEINTRGYYRYNQPDLYPGEWIIRKLAKAEIPVLISSDAHRPEEITKGMEYATNVLMQNGITHITGLVDERWQQFPLTTEGININ